jgi:outer membrane protein OmpA-like peptidoglycan-associated protein
VTTCLNCRTAGRVGQVSTLLTNFNQLRIILDKINMSYIRLLIIIVLNFVLSIANAQDSLQNNLALVEGVISDFDQNVKVGEIILFENIATNDIHQTVSNDSGAFNIELPYSQTYLIKIKGFNDAQNYIELNIPALKEEQSVVVYNVNIQFEPPKLFTLDMVYFEFGTSSLTKESFSEMEELLEFMKRKKLTVIEIAGHTDDVGEPEENLILSQKRAESVRSYLISNGIEAARVIARGYGEEQPIATNDTIEGRQMNRRTEVRILKEIN